MIISLAGSRGVGKSTVIQLIKQDYPDCIIREGFRNLHNGLNNNILEEFIENEKQYIRREIEDYKNYKAQDKLVILTRGLEEVTAYMDFFIEKYHPEWDKSIIHKALGNDFLLLQLCTSDQIFYLDAVNSTILSRLNNDTLKKRDKVDLWLAFNDYTKNSFKNLTNCFFIKVDDLSVEETKKEIYKNLNINSDSNETKNNIILTEDNIIKKTTNNFFKAERLINAYEKQNIFYVKFPDYIPKPINIYTNNSRLFYEETRISGNIWDLTCNKNVVIGLSQFLNKFYQNTENKVLWRKDCVTDFNSYMNIIEKLNLLKQKTIENIHNYFQTKLSQIPEYASSFIHGDLTKENIITKNEKGTVQFAGLIDFEWSRIGDPLFDIAKLNFVFLKNPDIRQLLFNHLIIEYDEELFELYFTIILLKQLSIFKELSANPIWINYLNENINYLESKYSNWRTL